MSGQSDFKVDFIIIGTAKAGTKWLCKMMEEHTQVCVAVPREVHFFHQWDHYTSPVHSGNFEKGISWYSQFFKHALPGQLKGESTPKYFVDPVVPSRIHTLFPDVKLILCMRNPVKRAASQYYFERDYIKSETRSISEAIRAEPEYVQNGLYFEGIQRYLAFFPKEQLHFIWFEDIVESPDAVLRNLYAWLQIDTSRLPAAMREKSNAARKTKAKWLREWVATGERRLTEMGLSGFVRILKKWKLHQLIARINSSTIVYEPLHEEDKAWLLSQFTPDILRLQAFTGRDLSSWLK